MMSRPRRDYDGPPLEYGSIKVGTKILDDATLNLGSIRKVNRQYGDKGLVLRAMGERNLPLMRDISNYFYNTNGIYSRVCDYFAYLYRYDWYIVPEIFDETVKSEKVLNDFNKILNFLDNSHLKQKCGEIALQVIKNGAYYGYIVPSSDGLILQELPVNYCRSIYSIGDHPAVEFDMRFFDENFRDPNYRMKVLKMFPKEFQKGYMLYKTGKLEPDYEHAQPVNGCDERGHACCDAHFGGEILDHIGGSTHFYTHVGKDGQCAQCKVAVLECASNQFKFYRSLFGLFNLGEEQHEECGYKDSQCNEQGGGCISDSGVLGHLTDEGTHDDVYGHTCGRVEGTTNLNELVASLSAATEQVEHGVDHSVEHTHAEAADKGTCQINPHALCLT